MSITKEQAAGFLAGPPKHATGDAGETVPAEKFQACCNDLANQGVPWSDLFVKAFAIYSIVTGPGTLTEKLAAIYALFSKTPGPNITAG